MEKKVYRINTWDCVSNAFPETVKVFPRRDSDDEYDATEAFRALANQYLYKGWRILYIVHLWCYVFVNSEGESFRLYMFED